MFRGFNVRLWMGEDTSLVEIEVPQQPWNISLLKNQSIQSILDACFRVTPEGF